MQKFVKSIYFSHDEIWLAAHGFECWDAICDMPRGKLFKVSDTSWKAPLRQGAVEVRLVLQNIVAEYEGKPDCPVERVGRSHYRLT